MDKVRFLLLLGLSALLLPGCGKDGINDGPEYIPGQNGDIVFDIGIAPRTRISTGADFKSAWEDGDEIGVFAVAHGGALASSDNYINNAKLTYSSADGGSWEQEPPLYWPNAASDISALDFYAYYPYDDNAADPTAIAFNVKADQSGATGGKSNYSLSDLLTAKSDNGDGWAKGSNVDLTFNHALAMIQLTIDDAVRALDVNEDIVVTLRSVRKDCMLNLGTPETTAASEVSNVKMYRVEQPADTDYATSFTFRALVPAQTLAEGASLFRIANRELLLTGSALTADLTMTVGQAELFTQNIPYTALPLIPAGTFRMGSPGSDDDAYGQEKPRHWVRITKDFYMGKYLVTNAQYAAFLNAAGVEGVTGEDHTPVPGTVEGYGDKTLFTLNQWWNVKWNDTGNRWESVAGKGNFPMMQVTWYGAKAFADWAGGRLPTEAEWEYACRAGTETKYSYGDTADGDYMWYAGNSSLAPHAVGKKLPNPWGLYDMHGLLLEWCVDNWSNNPNYPTADNEADAIVDPLVTTGSYRVQRGGLWDTTARDCRSARRYYLGPAKGRYYSGFRVVFVP